MKSYKLRTKKKKSALNLEKVLNEEQRKVAEAKSGPLLIIAGAGSGKTRTLTYRVAKLVEDGIPASRILLCTFTNKAAKEMVVRVERLLRRSAEELWAGTFHHIANRILRQDIEELGYQFDRNFTIIDRDDSNQLINNAARELGHSKGGRRFPKGNAISSLIGLCRSTQSSLETIIETQNPKLLALLPEIQEVWNSYKERKMRLNVLDFNDLLYYCHQLLDEFPEIRKHYSDYFKHVLVDEYQDINPLQASMIDHLSSTHLNLTVVGDDAQSIYSFRGAETSHILEFPDQHQDCKLHYLQQNYRSRPEILAIGNRVIAYNKNQFPKQLKATRDPNEKPVVIMAEDSRQEADFIAQRVQELHQDEGVALRDIAVLYRIHSHSLELQMALQQRGIPYKVRSGVRFFEQAHIKDILSFLRLLQNPRDELSWGRLLPIFPGVGPATVRKIWKRLEENSFEIKALTDATWQKKLSKAARNSVSWLVRLLQEASQPEKQKEPASIIQLFFEEEYKDHLEHSFDNHVKRGEDILQMANLATSFISTGQLLDELTLFSDGEGLLDKKDEDEDDVDDDALILSTIHQAKGLEWHSVFILNLTEGNFPFFMAVEEGKDEEERRLFYVAATRAKEQLYMLYPRMFQHRSWGWRKTRPSRFLWELLQDADTVDVAPTGNTFDFEKASKESDLFESWKLEEDNDDEEDLIAEDEEENIDEDDDDVFF